MFFTAAINKYQCDGGRIKHDHLCLREHCEHMTFENIKDRILHTRRSTIGGMAVLTILLGGSLVWNEYRIEAENNPLRRELEFTYGFFWLMSIGLYLGFERNIHQKEKIISDQTQMFKTVADYAGNWEYWLTPDQSIFYMSPSCEQITGYSVEEFKSDPNLVFDIIHPEDRQLILTRSESTAMALPQACLEFRIMCRNKTVKWIEHTSRIVFDGNDKNAGLRVSNRDITEKKERQERLLYESEERYKVLVHASPLIIATIRDNEFVSINPAFEFLLGYNTDEVVDKPVGEYVESFSRQALLSAMQDIKTNCQSIQLELSVMCKNNTIAIIDSTLVPATIEGHPIVMMIGQDVSKRKQMEQDRGLFMAKLIETQKMESLGVLAGGIAHDFNNILQIVLAYIDQLSSDSISHEKKKHYVATIQKALDRGIGLVQQILTFARKKETHPAPLEINLIIKELIKIISETFPKNIQVYSSLEPLLPKVNADPSQIYQALLNILVNARDALPYGGDVWITTSLANDVIPNGAMNGACAHNYVKINIADTGVGMNDETKKRIFEPFFTTKAVGKGTGLGLAVVYGIAEANNGFVQVQSEPGKGTSFHLYFPVSNIESPCEHSQARPVRAHPTNVGTILVIDDEQAICNLVSEELTIHGYQVLKAYDGLEGIQLFRDHADLIGAVISDIDLPFVRGDEVFRSILALKPDIVAIALSGFTDQNTREDLQRIGVNALVAKPIKVEQLLEQLNLAVIAKRAALGIHESSQVSLT
jgi:PAS domain S-box-containing protein